MLSIFKKEVTVPVTSNIEHLLRDGNNLLSNDTIILNEQLAANLFCSGDISIENDGVLLGNVASETCSIGGVVKGDISITQRLEVKSTAVVDGNIQAPALNIEEGAVINGRIAVTPDIASTRISLLNKINSHTSDEFLSAKINAVLTDVHIQQPEESKIGVHPQPSAVSAPTSGTLKAAEKSESAEEKPKVVQKELSAASTQPKAVENAEANNRWW